jgi:hypothetical protein
MENTVIPGVVSITPEEKLECKNILLTLINLIVTNN